MRTIKVTFANGNHLITRANGTEDEIASYFEIGTDMNIGSVEDDIQKITKVEFLN